MSTVYEPIHYSPYEKPTFEFGVCVGSGYGNFPTHEVVEWIEAQRLYGVAEFNLYDVDYDARLTNVFNYYTRKKLLRVFKLPHPLGLQTHSYEKVGGNCSYTVRIY